MADRAETPTARDRAIEVLSEAIFDRIGTESIDEDGAEYEAEAVVDTLLAHPEVLLALAGVQPPADVPLWPTTVPCPGCGETVLSGLVLDDAWWHQSCRSAAITARCAGSPIDPDVLARALHDEDCGCGEYYAEEDPRYINSVRTAIAAVQASPGAGTPAEPRDNGLRAVTARALAAHAGAKFHKAPEHWMGAADAALAARSPQSMENPDG